MLNHFPFMLLLLLSQEDAYLKEAIKMSLQESGHQGGGSAAQSAPEQNGEANLLDFFDEAPAPAPVL